MWRGTREGINTCRDICGVKKPKERKEPQKSRRQRMMEDIRIQKKNLKKQKNTATGEELQGLLQLWEELKSKHSALSKAEALRKKRSKRKKTQDRFFKGPFQFARALFEQPKSGTLEVEKEALEQHLEKTYSKPNRDAPLNIPGLVQPGGPTKAFNDKPPTLEELKKVVEKARAKSSPGPNGIPYLLYKKCPKVLVWLYQMQRSA